MRLKQLQNTCKLIGIKNQIFSTKKPFHIWHSRSMSLYDGNKTLFVNEEQTKMYAQFRPTYSEKVYETILDFCKISSASSQRGGGLAVDIGCGPGLSTIPLAKYFQKVIGVDVSEKQISNTPLDAANVSFRVSEAEELPFIQNKSVDLVTVAQALHWFKLDKFYTEVDRILKPGGALVAYGYGLMEIDHKEVHEYIMHVYHHDLGSKHWSSGRKHIEDKYASMALPFHGWQRNDNLVLEREWGVDALVGYLASWSAVQSHRKANPQTDLIKDVREKLVELTGLDASCGQDTAFLKVTWPVFMLMGHKPGGRP